MIIDVEKMRVAKLCVSVSVRKFKNITIIVCLEDRYSVGVADFVCVRESTHAGEGIICTPHTTSWPCGCACRVRCLCVFGR